MDFMLYKFLNPACATDEPLSLLRASLSVRVLPAARPRPGVLFLSSRAKVSLGDSLEISGDLQYFHTGRYLSDTFLMQAKTSRNRMPMIGKMPLSSETSVNSVNAVMENSL